MTSILREGNPIGNEIETPENLNLNLKCLFRFALCNVHPCVEETWNC